MNSLNPFEEKGIILQLQFYLKVRDHQFDTEGRISLSAKLLNHAKIKNNVLFVGLDDVSNLGTKKFREI